MLGAALVAARGCLRRQRAQRQRDLQILTGARTAAAYRAQQPVQRQQEQEQELQRFALSSAGPVGGAGALWSLHIGGVAAPRDPPAGVSTQGVALPLLHRGVLDTAAVAAAAAKPATALLPSASAVPWAAGRLRHFSSSTKPCSSSSSDDGGSRRGDGEDRTARGRGGSSRRSTSGQARGRRSSSRHRPKYKGVRQTREGSFQVFVFASLGEGLPGRTWYCGHFATALKAAQAHDTAQLAFGRGASALNFPERAAQLEQEPLVQKMGQLRAAGSCSTQEVQRLLSMELGIRTRSKQAATSSRYKGVKKVELADDGAAWEVRVSRGRKAFQLGRWDTEEEAASVHDHLIALLHPDAASRGWLNFPGRDPPVALPPALADALAVAASRGCTGAALVGAFREALHVQQKARRSSQYVGVGWDKSLDKWQAAIRCGGQQVALGKFDDEERAARAYDVMLLFLQENGLRRRQGQYARLNFPNETYAAELGALRRLAARERGEWELPDIAAAVRKTMRQR